MTSESIIQMCDPHFHMWDLPNRPNPNLGGAGEKLPSYLVADYDRDMAALPSRLQLVSRVHVETVVGQMEGGSPLDTVDETRWVSQQLEPAAAECPFGVSAYIHLARDTAQSEICLQQHRDASGGRLCGVRMILNHHPSNEALTWPQVDSGEILKSSLFSDGIAMLEENDLAFDLSCNPHQVADAVDLFDNHSNLRVVVNHLGFLHDGEDEAHEHLWRESIGVLAGLPNVYMKLSMLWFAREGYHVDQSKLARIADLVREVIETFGTGRCMFASNYPVDKMMGINISTLYGHFLQWPEDLTDGDRAALFHDTAVRAYNRTSTNGTAGT